MPRNPPHNLPENLLNTWPVLTVFIGLILATEIKDKRTPTCLGNSYQDTADSRGFRTSWGTHCPSPVCRGLRKQEMRGCKGFNILLAIYPSSHRSKDFLPQQEVIWNLRLSRVSFLPSAFLLLWFPARWASCDFSWAGFFSPSASTVGALAELYFCCACEGQAEVVSAKLNLRNGTVDVRGICNFLGSVSLQQKFERMDGPALQPCEIPSDRPVLRPCVTAQLYYEKQRIVIPWGVRAGQSKSWREERPPAQFWLLFYLFFLLPLSLPYVNWAIQEGCLF